MMKIKYSKEDIQNLIIESAKEANILPITSKCDGNCIFCSHKNNPSDVQVVNIGERTFEDINSTLSFLNPSNVITIGESASNIIEGEPTLHMNFKEIITLIRENFPNTPISITSNGQHLTKELVIFLSNISCLEMNISLNSSSIEGRFKLMHNTKEQSLNVLQGIELLHQFKIPFNCSLVGMPNITGYVDIENTIKFITDNGARCIRIFMPGFSSFVKEDLFPNPESIHKDLKDFIKHLSVDSPCPVLLEPSYVTNLSSVTSGVIFNSPAWNAGLRRDDIFLTINGIKPRTRVEAYQLLESPGEINAKIERNGHIKTINWMNFESNSNGVIMEYDFDMHRAEYIKHMVLTAPGHVLALTSEFAYPVIKEIFKIMDIPTEKYDIMYVENITFGGTIKAAGLLTYKDYINAYHNYCKTSPAPDAILIPQESFNYLGKDLTGHHINEIQSTLKKRVAVV